jgi:hypothetical protein
MAGQSHFRLLSALTIGVLACAALAGCITLDSFVKKHDAGPTGKVNQIAVTWDKGVAFVPDFTHGGAMSPGLLCRVYLFGSEGAIPIVGDGTISVDLYDDGPLAFGGQACMKERWNIDKDTLKGCLRKDLVGWGYTLFLPWATYTPDMKQVHMVVCYVPQGGFPFYKPSETMSLVHPDKTATTLAKRSPAADTRATQAAKADPSSPDWVTAKK